MDIITVSDISDVRDGGDPSEEEPAFIQNSFTIEELHKLRWSLFTDTPETMVRLCSVFVNLNLNFAFTGEGDGRIAVLFKHSQCRPLLNPIRHLTGIPSVSLIQFHTYPWSRILTLYHYICPWWALIPEHFLFHML